jgi:hypothetical protein
VAGEKVTYNKLDPAGACYNVDVTPTEKIALTADNGNAGASDGDRHGQRDRPRSQPPA